MTYRTSKSHRFGTIYETISYRIDTERMTPAVIALMERNPLG